MMATEELEVLIFGISTMALKTVDELIKNDNLLKGRGTLEYEGHKFLIEVSRAEE